MSILEAAKDKNQRVASYPQDFSGAKSSSPPKGKITKAKLPANHSNTLSILSNLTITLSVKGRAENGFVGLVTRRGKNPQNCGNRHAQQVRSSRPPDTTYKSRQRKLPVKCAWTH